ncbi:hypothetical protein CYMTET_55643 [Cymbomonas tetramitiformis]|uniref:Uncharacterized protein n=1 Tax=Cymbomonas tetramitiformis TaxID=36881 RepID=A0AAE0BCY5_9CHLO|nr:hypothetical protein CYMTET_55643 [Cymbomonas tetramitiformis]
MGADVNAGKGQRALHLAAKNGLREAVRHLLEAGAELGHADDDSALPACLACVAGNVETVRSMKEIGTNFGGAVQWAEARGLCFSAEILQLLARAATAEASAREAVTKLQGHEGERTWGAPKAVVEGGVSVYFVNGPDGRACAVREGEVHRHNNFSVQVNAAGELWYHCLAGTCPGGRRLQPPRAVDEGAEHAGAPAAVQQKEADKRRRIDAGGSAPDAAEMGSCGVDD